MGELIDRLFRHLGDQVEADIAAEYNKLYWPGGPFEELLEDCRDYGDRDACDMNVRLFRTTDGSEEFWNGPYWSPVPPWIYEEYWNDGPYYDGVVDALALPPQNSYVVTYVMTVPVSSLDLTSYQVVPRTEWNDKRRYAGTPYLDTYATGRGVEVRVPGGCAAPGAANCRQLPVRDIFWIGGTPPKNPAGQ